MEPLEAPSPAEISEAIVVWTAWESSAWPSCDEARVVERFGEERALDLMPILQRLQDEFFESDAAHTVRDHLEMVDKAEARFVQLHPELSKEAIDALAWCYSYAYR